MYIDINKNTVETTDNIAATREEFENGGYIELTSDLEQLLEDPEFDILEYAFPFIDEPVYVTYIKGAKFLKIRNGLNPRNYVIGETLADYQAGKYVPLSDAQVEWKETHPDCSPEEAFNMSESLALAKEKKLKELAAYDASSTINSFMVNGTRAWLTVPERTNYNTSIAAAELLGQSSVSFFIAGISATVPVLQAKQMLATVQLYADTCYMVTKGHEVAIAALQDVAAVKAYDYTTGYPTNPSFNL